MSLNNLLFKPVDIAPLAIFRVGFGLLLFLEGVGAVMTGWVQRAFIDPDFTFSFIPFFPWLQPLPGQGMVYYYILMGVLGALVMLGWQYRVAITGYFLMWTLAYWMQKTNYNNHYYLLVLLTGLATMLPAHRYFSMDVRRGSVAKAYYVPNWTRTVFMLLLWVVYTYAALAKVQSDWLAAKPIAIWFGAKENTFLVGPLLAKEWFQYLVAYGGIVFDALIIPAIWFRPTRIYALGIALFFHLFNSLVFQIGIFPYLMLFMSVLFFPPLSVRKFFFARDIAPEPPEAYFYTSFQKKGIMFCWCVFFLFMLILPIRHWAYTGDVNWTEEGHRMSWRMMLRSKYGTARFTLVDGEGNRSSHLPSMDLSGKQALVLPTRPDMIWQYAQYLKTEYAAKEVYADVKVSLNGRPLHPFIDPGVDLANEPWRPFKSHPWILPAPEP
ncbi:HTTM domain-containing protein [Pleomorphovibrio marinus]|uniref:HTTM domain-containing protein n=1 Tax=Pleomorphovibrio marinus TaxID=2164132 RepID=UPI001E522E8C|nr:HTTM domain-containing protein [Pleomorphovibrio marinus]